MAIAAGPENSVRATALSLATPRVATIVVWSVWAICLAAALALVACFGPNVPHLDDWGIVPALTGNEPITLSWLWSTHNEHRIPLPRLLMVGLFRLCGNDFRSAMYFNALALGLVAALMIITAGRIRGRTSVTDAFFPLLLLHWGHGDNLLWFWQIGFVIATVLAMLLLIIVARSGHALSPAGAMAGGICMVLLPLCGANALAYVPAMAAWAAWAGGSQARSPVRKTRRAGYLLVTFAAASVLLTGLYFIGFKHPPMPERSRDFAWAQTAFEFLSCGFGQPYAPFWAWWAWGVTALLLVSVAACLRAWCRGGGESRRAFGLVCFLGGIVCLAIGIGWGRSGFGPGMGFSRRYVSLSAPLPCWIYFAVLLYCRPKLGRILASLLLLIAALMLWPNTRETLNHARSLRDYKVASFIRDVQAGLPPFALADRYARYPLALAVPEFRGRMSEYMVMLKRAGVGVFRQMRDDPPYQVLPLNEQTAFHVGSNAYVCRRTQFAYAVRLHCRYQPPVGTVAALVVNLSRANARGTSTDRVIQEPVLQEPYWKTVILWIDQPVARIAASACERPGIGEIREMELLVPVQNGTAEERARDAL